MKPSSSVAGFFAFIAAGCGAGSATSGVSGAPAESPRAAVPRAASDETPNGHSQSLEARGSTDRAPGNDLAVPATDERFTVARQVTALERAIELYREFIERAGDDPRYAEAVRRSKGRIEDATLTICFLLEKSCDGSESR
jgi:hypothetical protein